MHFLFHGSIYTTDETVLKKKRTNKKPKMDRFDLTKIESKTNM